MSDEADKPDPMACTHPRSRAGGLDLRNLFWPRRLNPENGYIIRIGRTLHYAGMILGGALIVLALIGFVATVLSSPAQARPAFDDSDAMRSAPPTSTFPDPYREITPLRERIERLREQASEPVSLDPVPEIPRASEYVGRFGNDRAAFETPPEALARFSRNQNSAARPAHSPDRPLRLAAPDNGHQDRWWEQDPVSDGSSLPSTSGGVMSRWQSAPPAAVPAGEPAEWARRPPQSPAPPTSFTESLVDALMLFLPAALVGVLLMLLGRGIRYVLSDE